MPGTPIHLATSTSARYLPYAATMLESLIASNPPGNVVWHLVHEQTVPTHWLQLLQERGAEGGVQVQLVSPPSAGLEGLPLGQPTAGYSPAVWFRTQLPVILKGLDRVVYIDSDTLVMQDLRPLWETDLGEYVLAAVAHDSPPDSAPLGPFGLQFPDVYLNSGVLVMDLARMREQRFSEEVMRLAARLGDALPLVDQDAINLLLDGHWRRLHPRWNVFATRFRPRDRRAPAVSIAVSEAVASPAILHFEGREFARPENYRCVHPYRALHRRYRARTAWPLTQLDGGGVRERVLHRLPVRVQLSVNEARGRARAHAARRA